jgi:hypothetical protein
MKEGMMLLNKIVLPCLIVFGGCVAENNFSTAYLNPRIETPVSFNAYPTEMNIRSVGILSDGNILVKHDKKDEEHNRYNFYYSLIRDGEVANTFELENEKYMPYIYDGYPPFFSRYDDNPSFLLTKDDKIVISVPFPGGKRGRGTAIPAVFNMETYELEEIYKKSFFLAGDQNKSPHSDEVLSIGLDPRYTPNQFIIKIRTLKKDGKYNIKTREKVIYRDDIKSLVDVYAGHRKDEVILLYNDEETAAIEVFDYKKMNIKQRYILPKNVSEWPKNLYKSAITLSPDGNKIIIIYKNSLLVVFLESNNYIEIETNGGGLWSIHDWAWDSTSAVFVSKDNNLYYIYFGDMK